MPSLSPEERKQAILARLRDDGRVVARDLAHAFGTSEDTIRRDLRDMDAAGLVRRIHGGALPPTPALDSFVARIDHRMTAKNALGAATASLLRDGQTVLFDSGTTTLAVARALPPGLGITAISPSPPVVLALADHPSAEVILIGGRLDKINRTVTGGAALEAVRAIRADVCVLGVCGVDAEIGITATDFEESLIKRAMIAGSTSVLAVVTADKLGTAASHVVAPVDVLDRVVTERGADSRAVAALKARGVTVIRTRS